MKPVPVAFTPEIVTFAFPLFVRITLSDLVVPSFTFPKLKLVGFAPKRCTRGYPGSTQGNCKR